jgi:hypothetical protein
MADDRAEQTLKQLAEGISIAEGFMRPFLPVVESYERLDEIRDVKRAAQEAAGVVADIEIGTFFQRYAHQRRRSYQYWSFVIAFSLTATVAASFIVLTRQTGGTLADELSRWTLVIPLLAFTGYAARQASRNRSIAEWSEIAHLRARSIDAFVKRLPEAEATQILHKFGVLVYALNGASKT